MPLRLATWPAGCTSSVARAGGLALAAGRRQLGAHVAGLGDVHAPEVGVPGAVLGVLPVGDVHLVLEITGVAISSLRVCG